MVDRLGKVWRTDGLKKYLYVILIGLFLVSCVSAATKCENVCAKTKMYKEGKTYTLTGKVERINYEHPNGRHFFVYLLKLDKKFKIKTAMDGKPEAKKVQLALMYSGDSKKNKLYKLRGKHVKVRGKLYGGMTAYYVVPVYMKYKTIEKIK